MSFFIPAFLIFYALLAGYRLKWSIILLLAALPSYLIRFEFFGTPFTLLEVMILISFAFWLIFYTNFFNFVKGKYGWRKFKENKKNRLSYPFGIETCLVLVVSFVAVAVAGFSNDALGVWKAYFFEPVLVFVLILNLFQTKKDWIKIVGALAFSSFIISAWAVIQKFTGWGIVNEFWAQESSRRVTSLFPYPNALALYLGPLILILYGFLADKIKKLKEQKLLIAFVLITIILSILSLYYAKSEGGLIAVILGLAIFGLLANRKSRWVTLLLIFIISGFIYLHNPAQEYLNKKLTLTDLSGEIRKQQWKETWEMLKQENIFLGTGLSNYQKAVRPYHEEGIFYNKDNDPEFRRKLLVYNEEYKSKYWQPVEIYLYPHNIILNFWAELGLLGMLLFIWIIIKFFYLGFANWKLQIGNYVKKDLYYLNLGLLGAMIVIIIHGLVDVPYFKNDLAVIFWFLLAFISLINLNLKYVK